MHFDHYRDEPREPQAGPSVSLFDLESARQESDRLKKSIFEALELLRPQTRTMNPSLAAVRQAVVILQRAH